MNQRALPAILMCFLGFALFGQTNKLPLIMKNGHLYSEWEINQSIKVNVLLETGFPKVLIDKKFADKYLVNEIKITKANDHATVATWGDSEKSDVIGYATGELILNGQKQYIDGLIIDFTKHKSWNESEMVFPIKDLNSLVKINVKGGYMEILDFQKSVFEGYNAYEMKYDNWTKGLSMKNDLEIFDSKGKSEKITGNFLFDLGAANAFYLNLNHSEVNLFVESSDRMVLKDTTRIKSKTKNQLSVIIPERLKFSNLEMSDVPVVALKMNASKSSNQYLGVIGNGFFEKLIVIFDFINQKMYWKLNSDSLEPISLE